MKGVEEPAFQPESSPAQSVIQASSIHEPTGAHLPLVDA